MFLSMRYKEADYVLARTQAAVFGQVDMTEIFKKKPNYRHLPSI